MKREESRRQRVCAMWNGGRKCEDLYICVMEGRE